MSEDQIRQMESAMREAADSIKRLREQNTVLVKMFLQKTKELEALRAWIGNFQS